MVAVTAVALMMMEEEEKERKKKLGKGGGFYLFIKFKALILPEYCGCYCTGDTLTAHHSFTHILITT
jgi:hypothetical protein